MSDQKAHSADPTPAPDVHSKPLLAVTMGDPAGIGAEVIVKALADPKVRRLARFVVYGLNENLSYAADLAEISPYWFRCPHEEVSRVESGVVVADFDDFTMFNTSPRQPTADGGHASLRFLDEAIAAVGAGFADGIVTAPIHKTSWRMAGCRVPGHTEYLAKAFKARRVTMAFVGGGLRVALASTHIGLFELRNSFTLGRVFQPIDQLDDALRRWFGIEQPRIAVAGLNPHCSEGGLFGDEETRVIEPAMVMAREQGIDVRGPYPADTLFWKAAQGEFDGVVAMYHDQALIPVKLLAFHSAVNVTLGLPAVRTSVDHGTAFDIAGKNLAHPGSMKSAIRLAAEIAVQARRRQDIPREPATVATRPPTP